MIVRKRPNWLGMLFVWRGSVLPNILPQLIATTAFAALVTVLHGQLFSFKVTLTFVPFSLFGVAIAIFLGFRNSASYDRFWEARKLWGALIIHARDFARQTSTLVDRREARTRLVHGTIAVVQALKHQLRGTDPLPQLLKLLPEAFVRERLTGAHFRPILIIQWLGEEIATLRREGAIDAMRQVAMEQTLSGLTDVVSACERIAGTPIPFTYAVIIHRTIYIYAFLLPFGLVDSVGLLTPLAVAFLAYTFFALEALSDQLEEPFGLAANDLPLDAMAVTIEISLREMLGETELPAPPQPKDYLLS